VVQVDHVDQQESLVRLKMRIHDGSIVCPDHDVPVPQLNATRVPEDDLGSDRLSKHASDECFGFLLERLGKKREVDGSRVSVVDGVSAPWMAGTPLLLLATAEAVAWALKSVSTLGW